ncbi:MAG: acyl carrier protein [Propionibacteriaceae bacterium]|nr:acyl carrier protein [Propionibacteriaceae bacterium]
MEIDKRRVAALIAEILEIGEEIDDMSEFSAHYGADSLRTIEILGALEREFGVEIPQEELSRMKSLSSVLEVLEEARSRRA